MMYWTSKPKTMDSDEDVDVALNAQEKLSTVRILRNRLETIMSTSKGTNSDDEVLKLLRELDNLPFPMNRDIQEGTGIEKTVNQLLKNPKYKEAHSLATELINKWRNFLLRRLNYRQPKPEEMKKERKIQRIGTEEAVIIVRGKLVAIQKQLQSDVSGGTNVNAKALKLFRKLFKLQMNQDIFVRTQIAKIVDQLRKSTTNKAVSSLGATLMKKWKDFVEVDEDEETEKELGSKPNNLVENPTSKSMEEPKKRKKEPSTSSGGYKKSIRGVDDEMRSKGGKLLLEAIQGDGHLPDGAIDPDYLAEQLEQYIFEEFKNNGEKYRSRIRSRVANLKDAKNPNLRLKLLLGELTPERLAKMTPEEMASDELKALRAESVPKMINEAELLATNEGKDPEQYKCGECGSGNTYSYKLYKTQTRSVDEPMITFVCCNGCRYQWKLN